MRFFRNLWVAGGLICVGLVCAAGLLKSGLPAHSAADAPVSGSPLAEYQARPEPVGWVFGRVIGFPGADKPLLPPAAAPRPLPPSQSWKH